MRAMMCKAHGAPETLVLEELPAPALSDGTVRIGVHACGVNFPDLLIIKGEYQFKPQMPFAPGGEVAGEVIEVGAGVTSLKLGDRVMCLTGFGGYSDEIVIAEERCMKLPSNMDYATGAGFSMTYGTSYYALVQCAEMKPGESLLIHGATGGVGTSAVEIGKLLGAKIIATGGNDDKLRKLQEAYGVEHVINYNNGPFKDAVKALTNGQGADVIYDAVGGDVFDQSLRCINWNGRLLVIGFASGRIPSAPANMILIKNCKLVGVFWGAFTAREPQTNKANFEQMFRWFEEGKLKPIVSQRFPLARAADAMNAIANRTVVGKAVLTTDRYTGN